MALKLLIPLDGSALSEEALQVVKQLFGRLDAEITLFRADRPPKATPRPRHGLRRTVPLAALPGAPTPGVLRGAPPEYAETKDQAIERREHELLDYLREAAKSLLETGRPVHAAVHFGDPATEILSYAQEHGIDVIVMATHGRSGLREALLGSVTAAVVRGSPVPVLVIRPTGVGGQAPSANGAGESGRGSE